MKLLLASFVLALSSVSWAMPRGIADIPRGMYAITGPLYVDSNNLSPAVLHDSYSQLGQRAWQGKALQKLIPYIPYIVDTFGGLYFNDGQNDFSPIDRMQADSPQTLNMKRGMSHQLRAISGTSQNDFLDEFFSRFRFPALSRSYTQNNPLENLQLLGYTQNNPFSGFTRNNPLVQSNPLQNLQLNQALGYTQNNPFSPSSIYAIMFDQMNDYTQNNPFTQNEPLLNLQFDLLHALTQNEAFQKLSQNQLRGYTLNNPLQSAMQAPQNDQLVRLLKQLQNDQQMRQNQQNQRLLAIIKALHGEQFQNARQSQADQLQGIGINSQADQLQGVGINSQADQLQNSKENVQQDQMQSFQNALQQNDQNANFRKFQFDEFNDYTQNEPFNDFDMNAMQDYSQYDDFTVSRDDNQFDNFLNENPYIMDYSI